MSYDSIFIEMEAPKKNKKNKNNNNNKKKQDTEIRVVKHGLAFETAKPLSSSMHKIAH